MSKTLIVGFGEVGKALSDVLCEAHEVYITDTKWDHPAEVKAPDVMHVCFPYCDEFVAEVRRYRDEYHPRYTVIHSTVPVGTSRTCEALHSPVIGLHPRLSESLRTFTKFIGGRDAGEVADHFRRAGMRVYLVDKPETTELMKILSTTTYAIDIEWVKEIKRLCDEAGTPFEAWTLWTQNYNAGYAALGHPEFARPNLVPIPKRIGGHCLLQNAEMLDSEFAELVRRRNPDLTTD